VPAVLGQGTGEEHLIEPDRGHLADAIRVVGQRRAIRGHGVVHRVPVAVEFDRDLIDRATQRPICSATHCPARAVIARRGAAIRSSRAVHDPTGDDGTEQAYRCLRHTSRAGRPKHGRSTGSTTGRSFTQPAAPQRSSSGPGGSGLDMHPDRPAGPVADGEHSHVGQSDDTLARARSVDLHRDLEDSTGVGTVDLQAPAPCPVDPRYPLTPRSDPKSQIVVFWQANSGILSRDGN
jgi:hypothetical protein